MFYLDFFFKTLLKKPMASLLWGGSVLGVILLSFYGDQWEKVLREKKTVQRNENPYFFALMPSKTNISYLQRKLLEIPGVEKVLTLSEKKVSHQIKSILSSSQISWKEDIDLNYSGLRIFLSSHLKKHSQNLIRSYFSRLAGKKDVTLGAIKYPEIKKRELSLWQRKKHWWPSLIIGSFYFLSLLFLFPSYSKESAIVEYYQRKERIYLKSLILSQGPLFLLLLGGGLFFNQRIWPLLGFLVLSLCFFLIWGQKEKSC